MKLRSAENRCVIDIDSRTMVFYESAIPRSAFIADLDGLPYDEHRHHCWWLARHVMATLFGRVLPVGPAVLPGELERARLLRDGLRASGWVRQDDPADGDLVMMSATDRAAHTHCGVYLADRQAVIHTDRGHGAVIDSILELRQIRRWHPDFYRPA